MWPFKRKAKTSRRVQRAMLRRAFEAAQTGNLLADWFGTSRSIDEDIEAGLEKVRARSRDSFQNNDYTKKFKNLLETNVIGPAGIGFQCRAKTASGDLDEEANSAIEAAWKDFCRPAHASASGRFSFVDACNLALSTVARDGEVFVFLLEGFDNPHGFSLHFIEGDYLETGMNKVLENGNVIRMGVEMNAWRRPLRYHFLSRHPSDRHSLSRRPVRMPLDAKNIIHLYMPDSWEQTRGVPWIIQALKRLHMLYSYEESELVAARVGAGKMGFYTSLDGDQYAADDEDSNGNLIMEVSPGTFEQLPSGVDVKTFDPDHPNAQFEYFCKAILRGIASGLNVSYTSLSSNLEGVNYSSIRQGVLDERDAYKKLQGWFIEHFCQPIFERWLRRQLLSQKIQLPLSKFDIYNAADWQPRRWSWVDPAKDLKAHELAVGLGLTSRQEIKREMGGDLRETFEKLKTENEMAAKLGLKITLDKTDSREGDNDDQDDQNRQAIPLSIAK